MNAEHVEHVPSGATVLAPGTIEWWFGLHDGYDDGFCDRLHTAVNSASQRIAATTPTGSRRPNAGAPVRR